MLSRKLIDLSLTGSEPFGFQHGIRVGRPAIQAVPRMVPFPHRSTSLGRWKALILICLLTFPLVQVVPCSGTPKSPSVGREGKGKCWQVSSLGRCRTSQGIITAGSLHSSGYREVNIGGKRFNVHRLVAWQFLGAPPSEAKWQVNHLDGDHGNNQVKNLAWVTPSQNVRHSHSSLERRKSRHGSKPVAVNGTQFSSISSAARKLHQSRKTVSNRCSANATIDGCEYELVEHSDSNLPGEIWKPMISPKNGEAVPGRLVSSLGRVKSKTGGMSYGSRRKDRYLRTGVTMSGQLQLELVHRLVAYTFLGPPPTPEHTQVNHKDMNRSNNAVGNLEYVTPSQNRLHRFSNIQGPLSYNCKPVQGRKYESYEEWKWFPSIKVAANTLGLCRNRVGMCAQGLCKRTGGYEFRYDPAAAESLPGEEWCDIDVDAHLRDRETRSSISSLQMSG